MLTDGGSNISCCRIHQTNSTVTQQLPETRNINCYTKLTEYPLITVTVGVHYLILISTLF